MNGGPARTALSPMNHSQLAIIVMASLCVLCVLCGEPFRRYFFQLAWSQYMMMSSFPLGLKVSLSLTPHGWRNCHSHTWYTYSAASFWAWAKSCRAFGSSRPWSACTAASTSLSTSRLHQYRGLGFHSAE